MTLSSNKKIILSKTKCIFESFSYLWNPTEIQKYVYFKKQTSVQDNKHKLK